MTDVAAPPSADTAPNHTLYLNNLNDKIKADRTKATLYATLSQYGKILEIVMGRARRLRGQAWVTFDDIASASNALRAVNGSMLFDKPVVVHFAKEKADVIARREGTFVPREKRKREPKPMQQQQPTKKQVGDHGTGGSSGSSAAGSSAAAATLPSLVQNVPNKILFLQALPDSCNKEMLSVLFKQYQGYKVRDGGATRCPPVT